MTYGISVDDLNIYASVMTNTEDDYYIAKHIQPGMTIPLGQSGDESAYKVVFDMTDWITAYGHGVFELVAQRPGDDAPYPCVISNNNGKITWIITDVETSRPGDYGFCSISYYVDDKLVKTNRWRTHVKLSLSDETGTEPPQAAQGWVDQVLASGHLIEHSVQSVQEAARNAQISASTAQNRADAAKASADAAKTSEANAFNSANAAATSESAAKASADAAKTSEANAFNSANAAATSESAAKASADAAKTSEANAFNSANAAATSESAAKASADAAKTSETAALSSATAAKASEDTTKISESNAALSALSASNSAASAAEAATTASEAADRATEIAGGDFVTKTAAQQYADTAENNAKSYTDQQIAAIPAPDISGQIDMHNTDALAHHDIREVMSGLTARLNALADSDDTTLDQLSEVVAYIKQNKNLIDGITTSKVNVSDIINNLTTDVANKPLSAAQGVFLKALIDAITIPTKISELDNDSGYLTSYTESDPTVPSWAKTDSKPTYTADEVGAAPSTHASQHASGGSDPITPSSIGAAPSGHTHTASDVGALSSGGTAAAATKLATARTIRTNLASTSTASFDGTANVTPGVTGTLLAGNGGTGQTTVTPAVGTKGVRQIYAGTSDMTAGSTSLTTGVVYFVYE